MKNAISLEDKKNKKCTLSVPMNNFYDLIKIVHAKSG